jgi:hypothetical protein
VAVIQLNSGRHILHHHARNYLWVMARSHSFIHFVSGPCAKPYHSIAARSYIILARFRQTVAFSTAGFSYHVGREFNIRRPWMNAWMNVWMNWTDQWMLLLLWFYEWYARAHMSRWRWRYCGTKCNHSILQHSLAIPL